MKLTQIIPMALQSFRVNPFHTFLSCLGIIIGVGALFSVLSLADGMEQLARDQIAQRANLKSFSITSKTTEMVDGLRIPIYNYPVFRTDQALALDTILKDSKVQMRNSANAYLYKPNDTLRTGCGIMGLLKVPDDAFGKYKMVAGSIFTPEEISTKEAVIVITKTVADKLYPLLGNESIIGNEVAYEDRTLKIVGILDTDEELAPGKSGMMAAIPITLYSPEELIAHPPQVTVAVQSIESYESENDLMVKYLDDNFKEGSKAFSIGSYADIMKDVASGMLLFKIIMGMIVGISVVVGGIGIMNVLLMSIKERTKEIGVRKAIGASSSSIKWQFLMEALFLSFIGSALGVLLGIAFLSLAMAILGQLPVASEMPIDWVFSWGTTLTITIVAILIGVIFGTYPAAKASKLDPILAIRHE